MQLKLKNDDIKLISTDAVLSVITNYLMEKDEPILYVPSFECAEFVDENDKRFGQIWESDNLYGYLKQASIIEKYLELHIMNTIDQGKTLIVEGVHMAPTFIFKMLTHYGT